MKYKLKWTIIFVVGAFFAAFILGLIANLFVPGFDVSCILGTATGCAIGALVTVPFQLH